MKNRSAALKNYTNQTGVKISLLVTLFSSVMLLVALLGIQFENDAMESLCFIGLLVEFFYSIILIFKILKNKNKYLHLIPFLFLNWFIGCFCTNVIINIFENLPVWVYVVTFIFCFSNFLIYRKYKSNYFTPIAYFLNGTSFLLIIYYMVYLLPYGPISFIGILALGFGFYGLVPMIVFIAHIITLFRFYPENKKNLLFFGTGIVTVLTSLFIFTILLSNESKNISSNSVTKSFENNDDLPTYITISQNLKPNFLNEILLKKDIVYISSDNFLEFRGLESFGNNQYNERKTHNPFINIAYLFSEKLDLSANDRINILKSNFDKRLETEEQLWSGEDVKTKNIKEDIKIFADNRLAYTEITMDIGCDEKSWGQNEAIYSFQLPEGSVATSLSLWVNGIERKGVLTTKEKAKAAYKQIVGIEARDPSLMQWKEGNKVVVRVFPVSKELPRTFKCGFTTPLKMENNKMIYKSLSIKGPNISNAETLSRLQIVGNSTFETSKKFELKNNFHINESKGLDDWKATLPINNNAFLKSFVWKKKEYKIVPIEREVVSFKPSEIILDLNSSWKKEEIKTIVETTSKNYFVYINNEKQSINKNNIEATVTQFENLHYSLLPLFKLSENSLVITKCGNFSANFEELSTSKYLKKIKSKTKQKQIKVINIGEEINPFWQTVKEQNYIDYSKIDLKNTLKLLVENKYIEIKSAENRVNIEPSNCAIVQNDAQPTSDKNGINHIYRMYAFSKVLDEQVKIQEDSLTNNKYVDLAKDANIVTPITSLLVLETDEDYEKNGIEKNINTLGNASINNDGSVPEPHEWALIIVGLIALFFYYKKTKSQAV